jgi:S-formylglutathione hydrolase FrmB
MHAEPGVSPKRDFAVGLVVVGLVAGLLAAGCTERAARSAPPKKGQLLKLKVQGRALEGNALGDPVEQDVHVYLPPGYDSSPERRYPVLYLLHGFGGEPDMWTGPNSFLQELMDTQLRQGRIQEFIVVMPNGANRLGGAFYLNSSVTGGWEDFIVRDVVGYVDTRYRTMPRPESRGIAGHSMGGYGALRLGMRHPDVFGSVYALAPCCLSLEEDLGPDNPAWGQLATFTERSQVDAAAQRGEFYPLLLSALAAAVAPNPNKPPLLADLPYAVEQGTAKPRPEVLAKWNEALVLPTVAAHREPLRKLRALRFDVGTDDEFTHIQTSTVRLSRSLSELDVPHTYEVYEGTHNNQLLTRLGTRVLPFFSETLAHEPAK